MDIYEILEGDLTELYECEIELEGFTTYYEEGELKKENIYTIKGECYEDFI